MSEVVGVTPAIADGRISDQSLKRYQLDAHQRLLDVGNTANAARIAKELKLDPRTVRLHERIAQNNQQK